MRIIPIAFFFLASNLAYARGTLGRRILHEPYVRQNLTGNSSALSQPFFQSISNSPTLPFISGPASYPANLSSIVVPRPPRPKHDSVVLLVIVLVAFICSTLFLMLIVFYRRQWRRRNCDFSEKLSNKQSRIRVLLRPSMVSRRNDSARADFLYLGNLVNSRSMRESSDDRKPDSPELRPLPPLKRPGFQRNRECETDSGEDDGEEVFYSPRGVLDGSHVESKGSRTLSNSVGEPEFDARSTDSSSNLFSNSDSPARSPSLGVSLSASFTPNPIRKSPDTAPAARTVAPAPGLSRIVSCRTFPCAAVLGDCSQSSRIPNDFFRNNRSRSVCSPSLSSRLDNNLQCKMDSHTESSISLGARIFSLLERPVSISTSKPPLPPPPPPPPPPRPSPPPAEQKLEGLACKPKERILDRQYSSNFQSKLNDNGIAEENVADVSKPKLKRLHWDKLRASSDQETVWDRLKDNSFKLNEEMIEALFVVNTSNSNQTQKIRSSPREPSRVLEPKKAQNIAILLRAHNVAVEEVCEALKEGNPHEVGIELLESLLKMAPTKEEEHKLRDHKDGAVPELNHAEIFLREVLEVPFAFKRMEALIYISNFESEIEYLKISFKILEEACEELRNTRMFLKLLEAVLKTGNRMNVGTDRGGAHAFKLDTLLKLVDVKGAGGKTTLLHFVVREIIRTEDSRATNGDSHSAKPAGLQIVAGLSSQLANVKKAAGMDSDVLAGDVSKLRRGIEDISELVLAIETVEKRNCRENFTDLMMEFMEMAKEEISRIQAREKVAMCLVKEITEYFHGDSASEEAHPQRIFMVVRDFLGVLERVCKEVAETTEQTTVNHGRHGLPFPVNPSSPLFFTRSNTRH